MSSTSPPAPPQTVGAPVDERALKHHYFFQKLYAPVSADGDEDICFGTGYRAPKVPIVLQTIPEGRVSKQFSCRIDGAQFPSHAAAIAHMHDSHKSRIELLLFDLLQDMEQHHMGYFFTKLLYSDFIFPSPIFNSKGLSSEFPSVLAPDLERAADHSKAGRGGAAAANGKSSSASAADKGKKTQPPKAANGAPSTPPATTFGFSEEELQLMERRLFSGRFLVDASTEAKLSAKGPPQLEKKASAKPAAGASGAQAAASSTSPAQPSNATAPAGSTSTPAAAATAASEKAAKKKEAKEAAAREAALKETKDKEAKEAAARERQQAAEKAAKEKAEKERLEKERERQRREAERKAAEKERIEKEKAAKAAAEAAERERIRLESTAEFKKVKKQMEDELMTDLFEEVISDFMNKLAARTLQEQRKEEEKAKHEAAERAAAEAEAQQEQDISTKEKRNAEKRILRDLKKLEGDRVIDDIIDEVVFDESLILAPEMLAEMRREAQAAAIAAAQAAAQGPRRPSAGVVPPTTSSATNPTTSWSATPAAAAATRISTAPPAAIASRGGARAGAALPSVLRAGGKSAGKAPAVPAYQPFPLAAGGHASPLAASVESMEGVDEFDEYLAHERLKLHLEGDEQIDTDEDHSTPSVPTTGSTNIFGLFSSKLTEPVAGSASPVSSAAPFVPSPRRAAAAAAAAANKTAEASMPQIVEPPPRGQGMSPPPPPLRSVPEDFGFDSQLSVTCYNLPTNLPITKGEMLAFFRDCPIASGPPDFSSKIHMLRGPESGACYIQFESLPTAQKALLRDRQVLRDRSIRVVPAQGLRTSNSGQRFALNVQTRNAQGQPQVAAPEPVLPPSFRPTVPMAKVGELPLAPPPVPVSAAPAEPSARAPISLAAAASAALEQANNKPPVGASDEIAPSYTSFGVPLITAQHSLSSLLNTELDAVITPFDRKAKPTGTAIGPKSPSVGAGVSAGRAPGAPLKAAAGHTMMSSITSTDDEEDDTHNDETFASFGDAAEGSFNAAGQFVMSGGASMAAPSIVMPSSSAVFPPISTPAYMRTASPPAPQYQQARIAAQPQAALGIVNPNPRVITPPPPGFHVPPGLAPPGLAPPGFATMPLAQPPLQETRQPTVAPASSAEAAFMDRFL